MNERIEKLAIQAGLESVSDNLFYAYNENLERFAELVRQDLYQEIGKGVIAQINGAVLMEREACAKLVEEVGRQTAAAIRARR